MFKKPQRLKKRLSEPPPIPPLCLKADTSKRIQMPQILFPLNKVEAEVKKQIVSVKYTCTCGQVISPVLENGSTDIEEKSRKAKRLGFKKEK